MRLFHKQLEVPRRHCIIYLSLSIRKIIQNADNCHQMFWRVW